MRRTSNDVRQFRFSNFYCTECGCKGIDIVRKAGKEREPGHLKKLYCFNCEKENNMVEIKSIGKYTLEDFWIEFHYGNFVNGERQLPYKQFEAKIRDQEKKKQKEGMNNAE